MKQKLILLLCLALVLCALPLAAAADGETEVAIQATQDTIYQGGTMTLVVTKQPAGTVRWQRCAISELWVEVDEWAGQTTVSIEDVGQDEYLNEFRAYVVVDGEAVYSNVYTLIYSNLSLLHRPVVSGGTTKTEGENFVFTVTGFEGEVPDLEYNYVFRILNINYEIINGSPWTVLQDSTSPTLVLPATMDLNGRSLEVYYRYGSVFALTTFVRMRVNPATTPTQTPGPTVAPTPEPTVAPTPEPTVAPTPEPTVAPTPEPTVAPTPEPTVAPTPEPTVAPTPEPTVAPTPEPTVAPTPEPTVEPTVEPTPDSTTAPTVPETGDGGTPMLPMLLVLLSMAAFALLGVKNSRA